MNLLYAWVLILLIPLLFFYISDIKHFDKEKKLQRKLLFLSLTFMFIALSRPVLTHSLNEQKFDAQDFIIAIDASYSMQAKDIQPTRYNLAKKQIEDILEELPKNRFSIFAFTSNSMLISPPTTDRALSLIALNMLNPKYILTKGTSLQTLLETVAKTSYEKKKLIIFTDGGEEHNVNKLIHTAKKNNIIPYVVAIGTSEGALLTKDGHKLKDTKGNLIISRINPILKEFALLSGGIYYEINSNSSNIIDELISDISQNKDNSSQSTIHTLTYTELFWIPLLFSIILFSISITKIHQLIPLTLIILFPYQAHSSILDFYYINKANDSFEKKDYHSSVQEFKKLTPSVASYYNMGVAYYKDKQYKNAIKIFSQIQTQNIALKQKLYYNMGNCAVKLQKYDRAKIYYQKALNLGLDKDAYANLLTIYRYKEKIDISDMLPPNETKKQTQASKKTNTKKDEEKSNAANSNSKNKTGQSSNSSGENKAKSSSKKINKNDKINKSQYKIGYKAYELINKGYTNEKRPW
ncbi:VWA domain-containing protein [Sulfurimonas sp.]|uniref:vWA domain-containing protein n=1 Tax=Sulfurimonas sp. TaxID=2022749 RepID=UPI002628E483|nr:VWA domain-containing protein [Sulfurimonas sp.]